MDRNQAIGFILIAVLFIVYFQFFMEEPAPVETQAADSTKVEQPVVTPQEAQPQIAEAPSDSVRNEQLANQFGDFASMASGDASLEVLENSKMKASISTEGGQIELVMLKEFVTHDGKELNVIEPERNTFSWTFTDMANRNIDLAKLFYSPRKSGNSLELTGNVNGGGRIIIRYELPEDSYQIKQTIRMEGLDTKVRSETVNFNWVDYIKNQEKDVVVSRNNSSVKYYSLSGDFDRIAERHTGFEEERMNEPMKWFSVKQKFFTAAIIADKSFSNGYVTTVVDESDTTTVKKATVAAALPYSDIAVGGSFTYFFGPNDPDIMEEVTEDFEKNLYLGWPPVNLVNKWVIIPIFNLLNRFNINYGIIIIIMVIFIKLVLSPLSYKSYLSMAKMKVLKPELDAIKEKHDGDMTKAQQDQMALYRQVGVNPLSGCVPIVLQMPILFAMFYFFPQSIHLRQQGFLWADDLSTYDAIFYLPFSIPGYGEHVSLFVLLMTMSTILYTWSNNQVSSVQGPMKTFSYLMPLVLMFVLNSFPAALSFYYFVSNLITFGQQALIRRFVDEDKIKSILEGNRKKNVNKKKSSFQLKLEEAMKAGEAKKKSGGNKKKK